MTFWSGATLEERLGRENIVVPFRKQQIDCAAYTLRMGNEAYVTPAERVGIIDKHTTSNRKIIHLLPSEHFIIPAGQFAWLMTLEHISLPNDILGFISLRTTYKFKGLVNVSGFHVDPGFKGNLIYSVYNAGPQEIRLSQGDQMFLIWFAQLDRISEDHCRKKDKQNRIQKEFIVPGEIVSLQSLRKDVDRLDNKIKLYAGIVIVLATLISIILGALRIKEIGKFFGISG